MNLIKTLLMLCLGIAAGGYVWKQQHKSLAAIESASNVESSPRLSDTGFTTLPPAEGQSYGTVFIVAPLNCTHEEAKRADRLAENLSRQGIPLKRTQNIGFSIKSAPEPEVMGRMSSIMNGPLPIVFINGRAKSNPSLEEVVAEFHGAR